VTGRIASVGVATALLALLVASPGATSDAREGGTFRMGILSQVFDSIDPTLSALAGTQVLFDATCASVVRKPDAPVSARNRMVPDLATGLPKITDKGKTYTFQIRRGLRFSTGAPVTARDVVHTINRLLNPAMKAHFSFSFGDVVGAAEVRDGKARRASGVVAKGQALTIRLTKRVGDFTARIGSLCVVPRTVPVDPEGVKAPVPSAAPYYIASYVPGRSILLERNRFYRGRRPHHVDRATVTLTDEAATLLDRVARNELDYAWVPGAEYAGRAAEFRRKYGLGKTRFFSAPLHFLRMFVLNTERPLFRNNARLRQAVNFAADRKALLRERGPLAGYRTDQYLSPAIPGFRDERIYPLVRPDLARARALARGRTRGGKAVLYVPALSAAVAQGQILEQNLSKIGIDVEIVQFPGPLLFEKLGTRGEPFDIGWIGWLDVTGDPSFLSIFDGRTIERPDNQNWSYFDSPKYNRRLDRASRLTGEARYRAYGQLDVDLARNAAPAIAYAYDRALALVSARTGCVVLNPYLDLAAVCLK
jgi:peptide/nickel transport system substrate-binding protein